MCFIKSSRKKLLNTHPLISGSRERSGYNNHLERTARRVTLGFEGLVEIIEAEPVRDKLLAVYPAGEYELFCSEVLVYRRARGSMQVEFVVMYQVQVYLLERDARPLQEG